MINYDRPKVSDSNRILLRLREGADAPIEKRRSAREWLGSTLNTRTEVVFISYDSEVSEAAARIAVALRRASIEVWFDQNELRGGDAWDRKIRRELRDCAAHEHSQTPFSVVTVH